MPNPLFSNTRGEDVNRPSNPLNEAYKSYRQDYNKFELNRPHATTANYADITPFEAVDGVGDDKLEFGSKHHIRTYTLQSPMMSDLYMKKSYYMVDMRAILPLNWEKIYKEPAKGDDVPESGEANTWTRSLFYHMQSFASSLIGSTLWTSDLYINRVFKLLYLFEYIFSDASLFARFGQHYSKLFSSLNYESFDLFIEALYKDINTKFWNTDILKLYHRVTNTVYSGSDIDFAQALELSRTSEEFEFKITASEEASEFGSLIAQFLRLVTINADYFPVNYSKLVAYQLVCAEYFTNDKIDDIYSSLLYHQNQRAIYNRCMGSSLLSEMSFEYNGVSTLYDSCSGYYLDNVIELLDYYFTANENNAKMDYAFGYLFNIFAINKSLRYADYFMGARPEPYAPNVDMTAEVVNGGVSAIDTTRSILAQRFANAVARTNRKFSDYLTDVVGGYDVPDVEVPRWLASKTSKVSGFEVENTTSENQGNIVTLLNSSNSDYIYSVECGSPCIIIGVVTFSMERFYGSTVDRLSFVKDRSEMFNKFMQYMGDQDINAREFSANLDKTTPFAYQIRHMEYKQRYPIVSGAWKDFLPSMFVMADKSLPLEVGRSNTYTISPLNIRNTNAEFDVFYGSLTNFSLCGRFHFQIVFNNMCEAYRKMSRQPSIL